MIDAIFLFKENIQPTWEDPAHVKGGYLTADLPFIDPMTLEAIWEGAMFWLFSGDFDDFEMVTGIRVLNNIKAFKTIRFELWFSDGLEFYRKEKNEEMLKKNQDKIEKLR